MTSVAQSYSPHPTGLPQHPGVAQGHQMAGVHTQQGGPPGPGMPQQAFHMGVSGPGVPQVSQPGTMMAGMSPGVNGPGGPNAHALQHLTPSQAMYQQQQQQPQMACTCTLWFPDTATPLRVTTEKERQANMPHSCHSTNAANGTTTNSPTAEPSAPGTSGATDDFAAAV